MITKGRFRHGDTREITTGSPHGFRVGEYIWSRGQTNRESHKIVNIKSSTAFTVSVFMRTSRGFAKHVRREKQRRRR